MSILLKQKESIFPMILGWTWKYRFAMDIQEHQAYQLKKTPARDPKQGGVGSQCTRYKQQ